MASSGISRLLALAAAGYGVLTILRGMAPLRPHEDGPPGLDLGLVPGPVAAALTVGLGLVIVLVAHGLARRKQRAWVAATAAAGLLVVLDLTHRHPVGAVTTLALLGALLMCRAQYSGRADATMRGTAGRAFALVAVLGLVIGTVTLSLGAEHLSGPPGIGPRLLTVLRGFVGVAGPLRFRSPHHETQFLLSLVMFTVVGIAVACYLLLRAAEPSPRRTCADDQVIEALLARHGDRDSLGYFARRTDKSVVTSTSGKAALTYRVIAGTALVSADPLGDPEAWPGAVTNFLELCRYNSWVPAVLGCSAQAAQTFARHGMSVLEIGDEAVVTVAEFSLDGRAMRNVRQMVNRVRRLGYTADVRRIGDLTSTEKAELERLATAWRGRHVERGYSMAFGRFGGPDCVVVVASTVDPDGVGNVRALLQFVPWGVDGWSLDLMRRDPAADPGMNDFLIVSALAEAHRFGVRRVSLNFAMLRQAFAQGERLGAGWAARSWAAVLCRLSRWYQLDSLYRFNAKFGPTWVPRYLCYRGAASLPRVAYAAMEAEAFVRRAPGLRRLVGNTVVEGNRSVPTSRASSEVQQKAGV